MNYVTSLLQKFHALPAPSHTAAGRKLCQAIGHAALQGLNALKGQHIIGLRAK